MNYVAWLLKRIEDPKTSRTDYMRYWTEYQDILHRQKILDEQARQRQHESRIEPR